MSIPSPSPRHATSTPRRRTRRGNSCRFALRSDPLRNMAKDVRTAALRAADVGRTQDLASARKAMKIVYRRCEACHHKRRP